MKYLWIVLLFLATCVSVSFVNAKVCSQVYAPVCGQPETPTCDVAVMCIQKMPSRQVYANKCEMEAAWASLINEWNCVTQTPDVASRLCVSVWGQSVVRTMQDGSSYGVCFKGTKTCDEWALYRGECHLLSYDLSEDRITSLTRAVIKIFPALWEDVLPTFNRIIEKAISDQENRLMINVSADKDQITYVQTRLALIEVIHEVVLKEIAKYQTF